MNNISGTSQWVDVTPTHAVILLLAFLVKTPTTVKEDIPFQLFNLHFQISL
jgi:hypothetical protein